MRRDAPMKSSSASAAGPRSSAPAAAAGNARCGSDGGHTRRSESQRSFSNARAVASYRGLCTNLGGHSKGGGIPPDPDSTAPASSPLAERRAVSGSLVGDLDAREDRIRGHRLDLFEAQADRSLNQLPHGADVSDIDLTLSTRPEFRYRTHNGLSWTVVWIPSRAISERAARLVARGLGSSRRDDGPRRK